MIDYGADVNFNNVYDDNNYLIWTVSNQSDVNIVKFLLKNGININHKNVFGHTALHYAKKINYPRIIKLLIKAGAIDE